MANTFTKKLKYLGRYFWELFKGSILPAMMYGCASAILMMLVMKKMEEGYVWGGTKVAWTIVCALGAVAYHAFAAWASGGNQFEMLVSGNVKRSTYDAYGNEYKMSNHKMMKEYRPWKGFVVGGFVSFLPILLGIVFGCNQAKIDSGEYGKGIATLLLISFFFSGWTIIPFYCMNFAGISASYFLSIIPALIPIAVHGVMYIVGAYSRRNKALRLQILEDKAAAEEEAKRANKKINYGGLPGTKPRKRK